MIADHLNDGNENPQVQSNLNGGWYILIIGR